MNLEYLKDELTLNDITEILRENKSKLKRIKYHYDRYTGEHSTIYNQKPIRIENFEMGGNSYRIDDKVVNTIPNKFEADIVDTKIGYLFGVPVVTNVDKENTALKDKVELFELLNNIDDLNSESGKLASICGYSARLCYIDTEGQERVTNIKPWEVIFIGERITEPTYAIRIINKKDGYDLEVYDDTKVKYYTYNNALTFVEETPHLFDYCPLFGIENNAELQGDSEKVYELIDAYDKILSGAVSELEASRLAYLVLKGMGADPEDLKKINKTGVFELFDEKMDIKYLTKDVNDSMIMNVLSTLEKNIVKFAKTVNFSDEDFGGNQSGVAIKYKLMALENKCITAERKFTTALYYQYKVLFSSWARRNLGVTAEDYLNIYFVFTRNIPTNKLEEAQVLASLKGFVSEQTRLSQSILVDDVDFELENMEAEVLNYAGLGEGITSDTSDDNQHD